MTKTNWNFFLFCHHFPKVNESSNEDDGFTSLDSLEYTLQEQPVIVTEARRVGKKLDESEVIIVSPIESVESLDTSHVSVVTVGDEKEQVKDSSLNQEKQKRVAPSAQEAKKGQKIPANRMNGQIKQVVEQNQVPEQNQVKIF